jgi:hypothetical protein
MVKMKCSKCGKNMTNEKGVNIIGVHMEYIISPDNVGETPEKTVEFLQGQFGKYKLQDYEFCWECWLDSLMGEGNEKR